MVGELNPHLTNCSSQESVLHTLSRQNSRAGHGGLGMGVLALRTGEQENCPLLLAAVDELLGLALLESSPWGVTMRENWQANKSRYKTYPEPGL